MCMTPKGWIVGRWLEKGIVCGTKAVWRQHERVPKLDGCRWLGDSVEGGCVATGQWVDAAMYG